VAAEVHCREGGVGNRGVPVQLAVAELLNVLCAKLVVEGTTSRDLVAIEFDPQSGDVDALTRDEPHGKDYPDLISILRNVGQTCTKDRIGVQQLRRSNFADGEISLELVGAAQPGGPCGRAR
jgi:hypothetical protein